MIYEHWGNSVYSFCYCLTSSIALEVAKKQLLPLFKVCLSCLEEMHSYQVLNKGTSVIEVGLLLQSNVLALLLFVLHQEGLIHSVLPLCGISCNFWLSC